MSDPTTTYTVHLPDRQFDTQDATLAETYARIHKVTAVTQG